MLSAALLSMVSACGGSGGSDASGAASPRPPEPPPSSTQTPSPGGIWRSEQEDIVTFFFITERGDLHVEAVVSPGEDRWLVSGAGTVAVTEEGRVVGNFTALDRLEQSPGVFIGQRKVNCRLEGGLRQRAGMALEIECTPDSSDGWAAEISLQYDRSLYEYASSLDTIAGNYTLNTGQGRPHLNSLNINSDGVIFGMFSPDFGPRCTVNGTVSLVDPRFNLYWTEWRFSNCQGAAHSGAELSGTVYTVPPIFLGHTDSLFINLSGLVGGLFQTFSIHYEPV